MIWSLPTARTNKAYNDFLIAVYACISPSYPLETRYKVDRLDTVDAVLRNRKNR